MVNEELVAWIKSEEAQGYSEKALTDLLIKRGYPKKDIQEVFNSVGKKKLPFLVSLTLFFGFNAVAVFITAFVLAVTLFFILGEFWGLLLITATGALIGYYIYYVNRGLDAEEKIGALMGIFSPGLTILLLTTVLTLLQVFLQRVGEFAGPNAEGGGLGGGLASMILDSFGSAVPSPLWSGILFYLFCNLFMIIAIIEGKKYKVLWWYLLAPLLFLGLWVLGMSFTSQILTPLALGG